VTRVILCRVGEPPRVTWLAAAPGGGCLAPAWRCCWAPRSRASPMHDGVQLCCDRDGLLYGLALARRTARNFALLREAAARLVAVAREPLLRRAAHALGVPPATFHHWYSNSLGL